MKSEKKTVKLGQIVPNENNPRKDFGDVAALAEAIKATGGMPVNPIVCVQDGNDYVIVDGERRYRALSQLYCGDKDVDVLVVEDYSAAAELVAMLATDDKLTLNDNERAHGFQLGLVLGVEDEPLAQAMHSDAGSVQAARKVWRRLSEEEQGKYSQATLDQLAAAAAYEGEERRRILDADPRFYSNTVAVIRIERRLREMVEAAREKCAWLGVEWRERLSREDSQGCRLVGYVWFGEDVDAFADKLESVIRDSGAALVVRSNGYSSANCVVVYRVGAAEQTEEEKAQIERRALEERQSNARADLKSRAIRFVCRERVFSALSSLVGGYRDELGNLGHVLAVEYGVEDDDARAVQDSAVSAYEACEYLHESCGTSIWFDPWAADVIAALEPYGFEPTDEDRWLVEREAKKGEE